MGLMTFFNSAHDDTPLHERDIIDIESPAYSLREFMQGEGRVINFQYILKTGNIPHNTTWAAKGVLADQYIDWESDDAFTQVLDSAKLITFARIEGHSDLQRLLSKDDWNREDRVFWEREVSTIISEEMDKIPGLDKYRTERSTKNVERATCLNDLATDIENNTMTI